jgi:hypothetical protein
MQRPLKRRKGQMPLALMFTSGRRHKQCRKLIGRAGNMGLDFSKTQINEKIELYLGSHNVDARYTSYDYCYNYFHQFVESDSLNEIANNQNLQTSCMQLGFYLASWGMYRGSSQIHRYSAHCLIPVIEAIASTEKKMWKLDVDSYDENSYRDISNSIKQISEAFPHNASLTLKTKTMLGVFGSIPAFDSFFVRNSGLRSLNFESLMKLKTFYENNQSTIEEIRIKTHTIDFNTGKPTKYLYTRAKMIDMIFFVSS